MEEPQNRLPELVANVAAAYFANSHVTVTEISTVIHEVASALSKVGGGPVEEPHTAGANGERPRRATAAQVRGSIRDEGLVSFEDGRLYKTLKRHLSLRGLTPSQYREKWGLPLDYPTTAPSYSARRSELAKSLRLGQKGSAAAKARRKQH
jgi:predicted transcriptional regulator